MKTGRPVKNIDIPELKELMKFYPSLNEAAGWFDCSPDTISRLIKDQFDMTFAEFRSRYVSHTKLSLKRLAISKAIAGDSKMLQFCLKNLCGWGDSSLEIPKKTSQMSYEELVHEALELITLD